MSDDKIDRLPDDKRQRLLDAAIREFAEKGYGKASTNEIVKEAGIAKGLLFHYFGSKKGLYIFALNYAVDFCLDYFLRSLDNLPDDLLDRLTSWLALKLRMLGEYPLMYQMVVATSQDMPEDVKAECAKAQARATQRLMPVFLKGIDASRLREGVTPEKAMQFVMLALNGLADKFMATARALPDKGLADLPAALKEIEEYKEMLRCGLYVK